VSASILIASCAVCVALCLYRVRGYGRQFHLPTRRTDRLVCSVDPRTIAVVLRSDGFELPLEPDLTGCTVLLQLSVRANPGGRLLDPYVEFGAGERAFRQYFERGAMGQRYLNLSPLFQGEEVGESRHVGLRARRLRWGSEAHVLIYPTRKVGPASALVLAPHPDDAEIAAFGLYATHPSWIVTLTAGEKSVAQLPADTSAGKRAASAAALRVSDSLLVPGFGKVPPDRRVNLVFPDGKLESMHREPTRPFFLGCAESLGRSELRSWNLHAQWRTGPESCTWNELIDELRALLQAAQPDMVVCPHPGLDTHPDHIFTTVALEQAMRELPWAPLIFLYVVHHRGAPAYPFGPAESVAGPLPGESPEWIAESVYSHPLEPGLRKTKLAALQSMYATADARGRSVRRLIRCVADRLAGIDRGPVNLLRRGPRPNELFYVLRGGQLGELVGRALARRAGACS
jgi:LmbE family N-acetylglucosaminyl deacetylase